MEPIGKNYTGYFIGTFDGQGHMISNLKMKSTAGVATAKQQQHGAKPLPQPGGKALPKPPPKVPNKPQKPAQHSTQYEIEGAVGRA